MTRAKKTPSVHKPPFDEESALRFAEMEVSQPAGPPLGGAVGSAHSKGLETATGKSPQPERLPITLLLKAGTITTLQNEARRKGKAVDQIVDKLVSKHLDRH